eukprot:COSAG03_NODE_787_length_5862_cov_14.468680_10_plen_106_part_00
MSEWLVLCEPPKSFQAICLSPVWKKKGGFGAPPVISHTNSVDSVGDCASCAGALARGVNTGSLAGSSMPARTRERKRQRTVGDVTVVETVIPPEKYLLAARYVGV